MKQKHDIAISELQSRLLKMRMGMNTLESDFREKL